MKIVVHSTFMQSFLLLFSFVAMVSCMNYNPQRLPPHSFPTLPRPPDGLSYLYYLNSCPRAYDIVRERVSYYINQNPEEAAGILRILFHDCFVQGCDASILLERPFSEQTASPNVNSLRSTSLKLLDEIKASLEVVCPGVVSCADTIVLAARDAVFLAGGPWIPMLTGRRDSRIAASNQTVLSNLPSPLQNLPELKANFASKGLSVVDLIALSGAHTIGETHCKIVDAQLMPIISLDLSPAFAANLSKICFPPTLRSHLTVHMDAITPNRFDNAYFKDVLAKRAVFHSDAALLQDEESRFWVEIFASNEDEFFRQFSRSLMLMSHVGVLTGTEGEVRACCTIAN